LLAETKGVAMSTAGTKFFYYPRADLKLLANVPHELTQYRSWVLWKEAPPDKPGRKYRKIPLNPFDLNPANWTNPGVWGHHAHAVEVFAKNPDLRGLGFVFHEQDPYTFFDLDDVLENGKLLDWGQEFATMVHSYTEISPTGRGIKIIVRAKLGARRKGFTFTDSKSKQHDVECYDAGRFFAATGNRLPGTPETICDWQEQLDLLHPASLEEADMPCELDRSADPYAARVDSISDDELLERIKNSGQGEKFIRLMEDNKEGYAGYFSASCALCEIFAWWTRANHGRIDRLYRRSKMYEPSWWDESVYSGHRSRAQYIINLACRNVSAKGMYTPPLEVLVLVEQERPPEPETPCPEVEVLPEKPKIIVRVGEYHQAVAEAEQVLLGHARRLGIFQRAGEIVHVIRLAKPVETLGLRRPQGTLMLEPVEPLIMQETFEELMEFWSTTGLLPKRINCPSRVAKTYLLSRGEWRLPVLTGTITTPIMRPDASILTEPGVDPSTGLYLDSEQEWLPVKDQPSAEDAQRALKILAAPFAEFPFVGGKDPAKSPDYSVLLTGIATAIQRRMLPASPLFGFTAPAQRSGKTLLAESMAIIGTGRTAPGTAISEDREEFRKSLLAALREGQQIINLDNIEHGVRSPDLAAIITGAEWQDRVLGQSRQLKLPTDVTWTCTGNNLSFIGDLTVRVLLCRIDAGVERPEERDFKIADLKAHLVKHRPQLVHAVLTILRAFHVAGCLQQNVARWGGFEVWSSSIREPFIWAGAADPCQTRKFAFAEDPHTESAAELLRCLKAAFDQNEFTAAEAVEKARGHGRERLGGNEELHTALMAIMSSKEREVSVARFGYWLRKWKNRVVGKLRLERTNPEAGENNTASWRVVPADVGGRD
jgi:hypothetical protein